MQFVTIMFKLMPNKNHILKKKIQIKPIPLEFVIKVPNNRNCIILFLLFKLLTFLSCHKIYPEF